jgi:MFS transporter, putative metabolite:H+ symporter
VAKPTTLNPEIIGRAIDLTPLTKPLLFIIFVAAAGFLFDSFDIVVVSYAMPSIAREFVLGPKQLGLVGSSALAGMAIGSWCWGWVADRWGRRLVFAATVLTFSLFTGIAGLSASLGFLLGARFLTGLGLGGMVPIDAALVAEFAPARIRGRVSAALPLSWPIGIFAAAGAGLLVVPTIGWRWLFVIGMLPALLAYIIRRRVPESPRWLAAHGRNEEARKSLHYLGVTETQLRQAQQDVAAAPVTPVTRHARFADLFSPAYARRVVQTWSMWFLSNAGGYAFSVWLPTIYASVYHIQLTRTLVYTFIVAGTSVAGRVVAFSLVDRVGRKPLIVTGFLVAGCAALLFSQATTEAALLLVAVTFAFFNDIGSLGMTVYTPEVFPLRIRGIATAAAMGIGRVGGMVSPILIGVLLSLGSVMSVWFLLAAVQAGAGLISLWLAQETRGRNLELVSEVV